MSDDENIIPGPSQWRKHFADYETVVAEELEQGVWVTRAVIFDVEDDKIIVAATGADDLWLDTKAYTYIYLDEDLLWWLTEFVEEAVVNQTYFFQECGEVEL